MPLDLLGHPPAAIAAAARAAFGDAKGAGAAAAIARDAQRDGTFAPAAHGLGARAAGVWQAQFALALPTVARRDAEAVPTGTVHKFALALADGATVEMVSLPMGRGRRNLCVSTQVGCARACVFCATGAAGLRRNLTAGEIVGQVVLARRLDLAPDHVVFMGMGEPLDNVDALAAALAVLTDRTGLGYAQDRLTVCTLGHVPGLQRLRALDLPRLGLNVSLHAADDALRALLLPRPLAPLAELHAALRAWRRRRNACLGLHWVHLPGVNDGPADAAALARFAAGLGRVLVHLIPWNEVATAAAPPVPLRAPTPAESAAFAAALRAHGLPVRVRQGKGRAIAAACGQLAGVTSPVRPAARPGRAGRST